MEMQLSSEIKNIKTASATIIGYIKTIKANAHKDTLFDIKLCIEEAVRNAIVHGNKTKADLTVDISYDIDDNKIRIIVKDMGAGFKESDLPDPTEEGNLYRESGRGVYLMHRLMENISYNEKGNVLTMEKKLT